MKRNVVLLALLAFFVTRSVFADAIVPVTKFADVRWVSTLSVGPAWENAGNTQSFYLTPEIEKTYAAHTSTNVLTYGELFVGMQKNLSNSLAAQLGLAVAAASNAPLSGQIWDDADPLFANYSYSYKIQHRHVAIKSKLLLDKGYWLTPWISASVGVGFNYAHDFQDSPLIPEAIVNPNFTANTQTTFTYTLSVGVQRELTKHWQAGLGYEFADWGKSSLGRATGQTLNNGITLNHFYTNELLFNLTYCS